MRGGFEALLMSASLVAILFFLNVIHISPVRAEVSYTSAAQIEGKMRTPLFDCPHCIDRQMLHWIGLKNGLQDQSNNSSVNHPDGKGFDIIVTYSDPSGAVQVRSIKSKDLSPSWVWKSPGDENRDQTRSSVTFQPKMTSKNTGEDGEILQTQAKIMHPVKLKRQMLRRERRERRSADLIKQDKEIDNQMQELAIERATELDTTIKGKYSIWRKEYENPNSDSTVKLMRDQIIMAKAYATMARAKNDTGLYSSLIKHSRESQVAIGEATTDAELHPRWWRYVNFPVNVLDQAKAMGHILAAAKDQLYDCILIARKLRAMLQASETNANSLKKKSSFLIQLAAKTVPRPLHCIPLVLTTDYYMRNYEEKEFPNKEKLEDPSLYHYAIFSDNVLATSVVVNSTVLHAKEPERHVFHIVTDKLNFAAMKMWFLVNAPVRGAVGIQVQNVDDFDWLNSSYCPVMHQLESARMIEYYFKAHQSSSLTSGSDNLKYRNPKYLSMLNHLRFYLPEVYPKLGKILFLDDDNVVQKDLTPLWSVDLQGMVNGAVETCKESFHRFDKYLNFSNPKISANFDPNACGWAFGMNIFDLREWRKRDITGIYHHWQNIMRTGLFGNLARSLQA
ncbi:hypothetical protein OROGR_010041 [Orobanche gracilis]